MWDIHDKSEVFDMFGSHICQFPWVRHTYISKCHVVYRFKFVYQLKVKFVTIKDKNAHILSPRVKNIKTHQNSSQKYKIGINRKLKSQTSSINF